MLRGPQFLIIGAARSGTTALYQYLAQNPHIYLTSPKEPHYFALAGTVPAFTGPGDRQTINRLAVTDRERYERLYDAAAPGQVRGEASVSTLYYPQSVQRLCEEVPAARLVCMLRDPVDRAFSAYGFMRTRGWEPCGTFEEALADEERRVRDGWHHIWHYRAMGRYGEQLQRVLASFPREQVLVLRHEALVADPEDVLRRVHGFLGVPYVPHVDEPDPHRSGEPRSRLLSRLVSRPHPLKRALAPVLPARLRQRLRREVVRRNVVRGSCAPDTRRALVEGFLPDLELLERVAGLDTATWREP